MKQPQLISLAIDRLSLKGHGIGSFFREKGPPIPVEVFGTAPGDEWLVELGPKRRGAYRGFAKQLLRASALRVQPRCPHVGSCGGCAWQQIDYAAQLKEKEARVVRHFAPYLDTAALYPIIPSSPWHYRNKMEFSFSQNRAGDKFLGLMLASSKGRVFNLQECHLTSSWFVQTLEAIRAFWLDSTLEAYHPLRNSGALRSVTLREGIRTKEKLVLLTVSGNPDYALSRQELDRFVQAVTGVSDSVSIFVNIQQIAKGRPTQFFELHLYGKDHLTEELCVGGRRLKFKISPTSFFQPNTLQAERLYTRAVELAELSSEAILYDLYCGTGTLGIVFAPFVQKVIGIELNPHAIFDAGVNLEHNQIENVTLLRGDVGEELARLRKEQPFIPPDCVLVDPPRSGLGAQAIREIVALGPKQIVYISCNVATQATDVAQLSGYRLVSLQPVDQFPHTVHIETIAILLKS